MSKKKSELQITQEMLGRLRLRLLAAKKIVDGTPLVKFADETLKKLEGLLDSGPCPESMRGRIETEMNSFCELLEFAGKNPQIVNAVEKRLKKGEISLFSKSKTDTRSKPDTKDKLVAQLMSTREQAETSMPSLVESIDDLLEQAGRFDELDDRSRAIITGASMSWMNFVKKNEPTFEQRIKEFRSLVTNKNNRSPKDVTFVAYLGMHLLDFAAAFLTVEGGLACADEEDATQEKIDEIMDELANIMQTKRHAAKCVLHSLGISSPQEMSIQRDWLEKIIQEFAPEAGVKFGFAEVRQDGEINFIKGDNDNDNDNDNDESDDGFKWKRTDQ